ncbi:hypothetical protein BGX24_004908, partial [Mortierella sp. AD032]
MTTRDASAILTEYGLQLVASAEFPPLRPFRCPMAQEQEQEQNWTSSDSYEWVDTRFFKFARLIEIPDAVRPVPKWILPKLKWLELIEAPALQSNYDSLEAMRCQEELTLVTRRRTDLEDQL